MRIKNIADIDVASSIKKIELIKLPDTNKTVERPINIDKKNK